MPRVARVKKGPVCEEELFAGDNGVVDKLESSSGSERGWWFGEKELCVENGVFGQA